MIELPTRPNPDESKISKVDKDTIVYQVLTGCTNERAFLLFHPHYASADWKTLNNEGKRACRQFFSFNANKYFKEAYEKTLAEFFGKGNRTKTSYTSADDIDSDRKDKALKSLLNQAMSLVEGGTELDPDTLRTIADIFKRLGILKEDEVQQEAPRRYIPIRCRQECQYRFFVEKHVETGEIVSDCEYCKALAIAREHGYHYDPTTNLSIPEETETPIENNPE